MRHFHTTTIGHKRSPVEYSEFLAEPNMSAGIYHLKSGSVDPQQPHKEDEIYYVLTGRATFTSNEQSTEITTGSILYVAAEEKHQFHDSVEDLSLLVVFAAD